MRDGIQRAVPCTFPLQRKMNVFCDIFKNYQPDCIEIGSLVSNKIMPIMQDTPVLYSSVNNYLLQQMQLYKIQQNQKKDESIENHEDNHEQSLTIPKLYVLVPNSNKLLESFSYGFKNFSFVTSMSNSFQKKNVGKTLDDTKNDLQHCFHLLDKEFPEDEFSTKLYISCINKCPIDGQIDISFIINELMYYHIYFNFDELCLSDTCGTLGYHEFVYIINALERNNFPINKLSLHLHIDQSRTSIIEKILFYCFDKNITKFDVSLLNEGGCSVTMNNTNNAIHPNLSYEMLYNCLQKYSENKCSNDIIYL